MKYLALVFILLLSLYVFASNAETEDPCPTICMKTGLTAPGFGRFCYETYLCFHQELNEETNECEKVAEENRKVRVFCRDVPPAY